MGVKTAFADTADFRGITDSPPLKVSKVIQKAFIEVNEEGTEAGAVTCKFFAKNCKYELSIDELFHYRYENDSNVLATEFHRG